MTDIDGPWLDCPWCGGRLPLAYLAPSDEEAGAAVGVCVDCRRRVTVTTPDDPFAPSS
ncbi:hypothetical protein UG55_110212 [Frankia sp. EI5c]|uniref:hypothetical protein n=1 Tax=Frankia sp. EI5c TaxID=683316 RepID=UPI0007C38485|nr:hypothetical protein [Frankia sp. EI5c]OAA17967.1 hypothetical protein UG55_11435 [Frankia sp. EI5c]OAA18674.1 hypothetical protein UG55_110212 [Frankia sp. EI5c]